MKLPAEEILVRWINYHLRAAGQERQVANLGKDLQDSFAIYHVLNQLDKPLCPLTHINDEDKIQRATEMIKNSSAIKVPEMVSAEDWNKGNSRVNTVYVAEIFNTRHGLQELNKEEEEMFEKAGITDDDIAGTREERQFRLWINSLELENVYINNLYEDVRDGQVLLKVIHKIDPTVVDWTRVEKNPNNHFKRGINCQVAFDSCLKLKIKLIGIGASDIQEGNKKLVLAIVWQLMKIHYLQIIGSKTEQDLINWANSCKGNENRQIKNFKDANLGDGVFMINLTAAVEPRIVDWELVTQDNATDE
jgi:plastin-1